MSLYAIGDLHFSTIVNKPMNIFGENWENHTEKIINHWEKTIKESDMVLVLGDTSWGINIDEAKPDIDIIEKLPGDKILIKGNHDYWWSTVNKLNNTFKELNFLQNNYYEYNGYAICGGRGWICPNEVKFDENDKKVYEREVHRIRLSLESARKDNMKDIIVITHYPPTNDKLEPSLFTKLYEEYKVKKVIYGHLHGKESFKMGLKGMHNNIEYTLASCDYTDFKLVKIMD